MKENIGALIVGKDVSLIFNTPRPRAALLMCLKKYSAIGNSAIGNYAVLYSKLIPKTVLLEVSNGKND